MKKDTYVYEHAGALYINLTNRCTNACVFCLRTEMNGIEGNNLWLDKEPDAKQVIEALGDMAGYKEIVFCGYGEPTIRLEELKEVAAYCKQKGKTVRLNTNGHANAFHGRDITPELKGIVDVVSISLNAANEAHYQEICQCIYGEAGYGYMLDFAKKCVDLGISTVLSIVDVIDPAEIEKAAQVAKQTGAIFKIRHKI